MCFLHVVAIGCLVCPNVCSTTFTWDAVYATVSGLGILFSLSMCVFYVFLNSNVDSLGPLLACSLLTCLSFDIVMVARQLCLWDFTVYLWLVSVHKASSISS